MRLAIIGAGSVGGALGRLLAARGHEVTFGVRDRGSPKVVAILEQGGQSITALPITEAIAASDTIVLAVPWAAAKDVCESADLAGKVLIDATNPITAGLELELGHDTSAAEQIASWSDGARVVKAFNTIGAENLEKPQFGGEPATMFVCGDDDEAKKVALQLAGELGFEGVDAGPLANARLLEPLAMLWIRLALVEDWGRDIAFKLLRR
jgi:NADPH-dependent F420 reductase